MRLKPVSNSTSKDDEHFASPAVEDGPGTWCGCLMAKRPVVMARAISFPHGLQAAGSVQKAPRVGCNQGTRRCPIPVRVAAGETSCPHWPRAPSSLSENVSFWDVAVLAFGI